MSQQLSSLGGDWFVQRIPDDKVENPPADSTPLVHEQDYFQLSLDTLYLHNEGNMFHDLIPSVHSLVALDFGSQHLEIGHIAGPTHLLGPQDTLDASDLEQVLSLNYRLTQGLAYHGGDVKIVVDLYAIEGPDKVHPFLKALGNIAGLLLVPGLANILNIVSGVANGIEQLHTAMPNATRPHVWASWDETLTGDGPSAQHGLQAGYVAIVRKVPQTVGPFLHFEGGTQHSELWYRPLGGNPPPNPLRIAFKECSYLVLRIDKFQHRLDWREIDYIRDPYKEAVSQWDPHAPQKALKTLTDLANTIRLSNDFTDSDAQYIAGPDGELIKRFKRDTGFSGPIVLP